MRLAEAKGVTVSEFFRAVAERVLAPAKAEEDERTAAIKALPPGPRAKALRAVEIQRRLRELRAAQPKAHALSSLFHDGQGPSSDSEVVRLEAELAALGKAFENEVGSGISGPKAKKTGLELVVQTTEPVDAKYSAECPLCGKETEVPGIKDGETKDFNCSKCGAGLKTNKTDVWPAFDGDEPLDEDGRGDEDEPKKTAAEEEADRFLELTGLINSLRAVREPRSLWDDFWNGGPPACDLLIKELEAARNSSELSSERLGELREMTGRAVFLRKKVVELEAAGQDAGGPDAKKLSSELEAIGARLREAAAKRKSEGQEKGSSWWD